MALRRMEAHHSHWKRLRVVSTAWARRGAMRIQRPVISEKKRTDADRRAACTVAVGDKLKVGEVSAMKP